MDTILGLLAWAGVVSPTLPYSLSPLKVLQAWSKEEQCRASQRQGLNSLHHQQTQCRENSEGEIQGNTSANITE